MNSKSHSTNGFTLIEIIVVVTLLSIFTLTATTVDFSRLSIRQEQEIFTNQVIGNIETVKNYAFQGKGVGASLDTPTQWMIDISPYGSGSISTSYTGTISGIYTPLALRIESGYSITDITCKSFDGSLIDEVLTSTGTLIFIGDTIDINGCSSPRYTLLELTTSHGTYSDIIEINTVNNVIQKK